MQALFEAYHIEPLEIKAIHQGLINQTYFIKDSSKEYIAQTINTHIFKNPNIIDENIKRISIYLKQNYPSYIFTHLIENAKGETLTKINEQYFRVFEKINGKSLDVVSNNEQVYEAANAFGGFTAILTAFDPNQLGITLPDFHNLNLRYEQFEIATSNGNTARINVAYDAIAFLKSESHLVETYQNFITHPESQQRVTHHDTKISNVLFDEKDHAICVIDLDTVMPGYFISDVGDMCRTYLCNYSEEEKDLNKIKVIPERLEALQKGYLLQMENILTPFEKDHFVYSGQFLIYMQALRFLTDYLNNDKYYGSKYEGHNYVRALNQIQLLKSYNDLIV